MELTESAITQQMVSWFRFQFPRLANVLIHVPNEGKRKMKTAYRNGRLVKYCPSMDRLKAEGLVPGVADLLLLTPRHGYGALCIEVKTERKGSKQRPSQVAWEEAATAAGNKYVVVRTFEEFQKVISEYLDAEIFMY